MAIPEAGAGTIYRTGSSHNERRGGRGREKKERRGGEER